ncbi:MAG: winged helix-turn-helix transcriptional regulator [Clostridiales bacterium]|nr:winged helix-turn-helix transcriptional regulator [Candidatus Crickella caballi]
MKENIGTVQYASLLYDFYGALLGESQAEVMTMYHEDNLSLSEIAEELGMSRQAVHYTLKKAEGKLEEFEEKLGLVATYTRNNERVSRADEMCEELKRSNRLDASEIKIIEELQKLISELTD